MVLGSSHEITPLLLHNLRNLFTHGLAEDVSLSQVVASKFPDDKQNLILIHNDTIGLLKDISQGWVGVAYGLNAMFSFDEGGYVLHGSGTIQSYHSGNIAEGGGFKLLDVAAHARPL